MPTPIDERYAAYRDLRDARDREARAYHAGNSARERLLKMYERELTAFCERWAPLERHVDPGQETMRRRFDEEWRVRSTDAVTE